MRTRCAPDHCKRNAFCLVGALVFLLAMVSLHAEVAQQWTRFKASDGLVETAVSNIMVGPKGTLWLAHPHQPWISRYDGFEFAPLPAPNLGQFQLAEGPASQLWALDSEALKIYKPGQSSWSKLTLQGKDDYTPRMLPSSEKEYPHLIASRKNHALLLYAEALLDVEVLDEATTQTRVLLSVFKTSLKHFRAMVATTDGGLAILGDQGLVTTKVQFREIDVGSAWKEILFPEKDKALYEQASCPVVDQAGGVTFLTGSKHERVVHINLETQSHFSMEIHDSGKILKAWATLHPFGFLLSTADGLTRTFLDPSIPAEKSSMSFIYDTAPEVDGSYWIATAEGLIRHASPLWEKVTPVAVGDLQSLKTGLAGGKDFLAWQSAPDVLAILRDQQIQFLSIPSDPMISSGLQKGPNLVCSAAVPKGGVLVFASGRLWSCPYPATQLLEIPMPKGVLADSAISLGHGQIALVHQGDENASVSTTIFDGESFLPLAPGIPKAITSHSLPLGVVTLSGDFWFCGNGQLARYRQKEWQIFSLTNNTPSENPVCMAETSPGVLWFGFSDRIMQFDGVRWSLVPGGFFHVHDIFKSSDGAVWVGAEDGVHRLRKETWLENGMEEGLPVNSVSRVAEMGQGQMAVLTAGGICIYHADADTKPPRASIVTAGGASKTFGEGSVVSYVFSGADQWKQTPSDRLLFSYRMDDREWSTYREQRSKIFTDLQGGDHRLQVRCMDRNWNESIVPAVFDFSIVVPWYRETKLVLISTLGCAAVLFFAGLALNRHLRLMKSFAQVEAMVALRTQQLDLANKELFHSQKMNALGTLAAGIAHDFNNILSIIKGSAQIIEDNVRDEEKVRLRTERIRTVVDQGSGIVQAMLGFSRTSDQPPVPCDVGAVVRETILLLGDRFLRDVDVRFEPPTNVLPEVMLSKDFAQQILLNFIFNAADASPGRKPILLRAVLAQQLPVPLALKPGAAERYLFLEVRDEGTGISPGIMPRIFDPFFTTKALSSKRGTGLGLSMAYELAKRMNCGLAVKSTPGKGSTFTLIIPVTSKGVGMNKTDGVVKNISKQESR